MIDVSISSHQSHTDHEPAQNITVKQWQHIPAPLPHIIHPNRLNNRPYDYTLPSTSVQHIKI